jgi:hypothetical protein
VHKYERCDGQSARTLKGTRPAAAGWWPPGKRPQFLRGSSLLHAASCSAIIEVGWQLVGADNVPTPVWENS